VDAERRMKTAGTTPFRLHSHLPHVIALISNDTNVPLADVSCNATFPPGFTVPTEFQEKFRMKKLFTFFFAIAIAFTLSLPVVAMPNNDKKEDRKEERKEHKKHHHHHHKKDKDDKKDKDEKRG
jgi:hypothetical protein